jgi:hypothetical protein
MSTSNCLYFLLVCNDPQYEGCGPTSLEVLRSFGMRECWCSKGCGVACDTDSGRTDVENKMRELQMPYVPVGKAQGSGRTSGVSMVLRAQGGNAEKGTGDTCRMMYLPLFKFK